MLGVMILLAAALLAAAICYAALIVSRAVGQSCGETDVATEEVIIETAVSPNGHFPNAGVQLAAIDRIDDPPSADDRERME